MARTPTGPDKENDMKAATLAILLGAAMLPALAQTTDDNGTDEHVHVEIHCKTTTGKCKPPPPPPAPPAPPAPPVPPVPPPPPEVPPVPAEAHAACAHKAAGSALTWPLGEGEVMKGICANRNGKMVFVLRSHELNG
jgi:hypothetical protein